MSLPPSDPRITLSTTGKIATIKLNIPSKLNALTQDLYYHLATLLRSIAQNDSIYITILTGTGRYFSAGADVSSRDILPPSHSNPTTTTTSSSSIRRTHLRNFVSNNLEVAHAFYTHPKILITALNGPVVGLSAAIIAHSDFIYCTPSTFLLTPFTSLGLVVEGGASVAFVRRMGISLANEALIMSRRITAEELLKCGFVNKVFETTGFLEEVMGEVGERFGGELNWESLVRVKGMIGRPERRVLDEMNVAEVFGGLERFVEGIPQEEFRRIASGEKRHKL